MNDSPKTDCPSPDGGPSQDRRGLESVQLLLDQFEAAWQAGERPQLEQFLARGKPEECQELLRELIVLEVERERMVDETPGTRAAYLARFPEDAGAVEAAFAVLERRAPQAIADAVEVDQGLPARERPVKESNSSPDLPQRIGRFEVCGFLGRGGFANVYLAHDPHLQVSRAIKVPRPDKFRGPQSLDAFLTEARTAAQLDHSGIVRVYEVQQEADLVYIVQQYIEGQDLAQYAQARRLSPRDITELVIRVADAVGHAHQQGFFHRDLKPSNILVDQGGKPYVGDFGLTVHESVQRERAGERAGTLHYMSPEQLRGETHRLDGRSDIWSLGVILYELLAGQRPFDGATRGELQDEERGHPLSWPGFAPRFR